MSGELICMTLACHPLTIIPLIQSGFFCAIFVFFCGQIGGAGGGGGARLLRTTYLPAFLSDDRYSTKSTRSWRDIACCRPAGMRESFCCARLAMSLFL